MVVVVYLWFLKIYWGKTKQLLPSALPWKSHLCIPFLGIVRPQPQFPHSCVCERLYSPRIGLHISSSRIGRPIVGIYKSLTDAWMWKLGLSPRYSFSGKICFKISVFCLCSAFGNKLHGMTLLFTFTKPNCWPAAPQLWQQLSPTSLPEVTCPLAAYLPPRQRLATFPSASDLPARHPLT